LPSIETSMPSLLASERDRIYGGGPPNIFIQMMLQTRLSERFKFMAHREKPRPATYELRVALRPSGAAQVRSGDENDMTPCTSARAAGKM
jgi:uncharacterized protein (TIGR03435 family)